MIFVKVFVNSFNDKNYLVFFFLVSHSVMMIYNLDE